MSTIDRDAAERLRDIEIDSGVRHDADTGAARIHLTLRELGGLRRTLGEVVLSAEQLVALARGATVRVSGRVPREFDDGDALLDALDLATSYTDRPTPRSASAIGDDLLTDLGIGPGQATYRHNATTALTRAMRSRGPRKAPADG